MSESMNVPNIDTAAVVIPLYGFWNDNEVEQMTPEVLSVILSRVKSETHAVYIVLVAEENRTINTLVNKIAALMLSGSLVLKKIPAYSSYPTYLMEGLRSALEDTHADKIVIYNPWMIIQEKGLDALLKRIARSDVGIVSGDNVKGKIDVSYFDEYVNPQPKELMNLELGFFGFNRPIAEMVKIDTDFKTHYFTAKDMWQDTYKTGFQVISTEEIPTYNLDIDWRYIEDRESFDDDKRKFISKWGFDPSVDY